MFRIRSFVIFGIHRTHHAVALVRHILDAGLRPRFALVSAEIPAHLECSRPFWDRPRWWVDPPHGCLEAHTRMAACSGGPDSVAEVYARAGIPFLFVPGFASETTCRLLGAAEADAMVLAEGPIIKGSVLELFAQGIVNLHAAPLPAYRGNDATNWAIYHDEPLQVCAHLVDRSVDGGPLLARCPLPVHAGDDLEAIRRRGYAVCGQLAAGVLRRAMTEGVPLTPQQPWQGRTFRGLMPDDIRGECERRLRQQEYSHYV